MISDADIVAVVGCEAVHPDQRGGQHVSKPCTGVRLTHVPTGVTVMVDSERSQHANLVKAMEELRVAVGPTEIWLVEASRGDYSDRTEYAVCWFVDEASAKRAAETMSAASNEWRSRIESGNRYTEDGQSREEMARTEIGDSNWSSWDETRYAHGKLPRGKATL